MSDTPVLSAYNLRLPRVTIQFCTQCKWNLRAAYFAQELLQTFSTSLGEISLQPSTGGVFVVDIIYAPQTTATTTPDPREPCRRVLWDRATDGGFPETKELKRRVRDVIEPERNLGHVDRDYPRKKTEETGEKGEGPDTTADQKASSSTEVAEGGGSKETGSGSGSGSVLPRPRDIAARVGTLTHPPGTQEPFVPSSGATGLDHGLKLGEWKSPVGVKGPKAEKEEKCEDCA